MNEELKDYLVTVEPLRTKVGRGAYGYVEKVLLGGAVCAAKKVHYILINNDDEGVEVFKRKFYKECKIMSLIRHPNIVQFLGVYQPSAEEIKKDIEDSIDSIQLGASLPWLIMEYLPINLDDFLKKSPIPFSVKISLLLDIAKGLFYLHTRKPPIIHRDLTAKNVLITPALEAKIADFGVARIADPISATMTSVPGNQVYMPPEAQERGSPVHYSTSIDIFSFGVNILYVIVQEFPGKLRQHCVVHDDQTQLIPNSEVQRRDRYFNMAHVVLPNKDKPEHGLIKLAEECLSNIPSRRPLIHELHSELSRIKEKVPMDPVDMLTGQDFIRQPNGVKVNGSRSSGSSTEAEFRHLQIRVTELEDALKDLDSRNLILTEDKRSFDEMRRRMEGQLAQKEEEIGRLRGVEVTNEGRIQGLEAELKSHQTQLELQRPRIEWLDQQLARERDLSADRQMTIEMLEEQLRAPNRESEVLKNDIDFLKQKAASLESENNGLRSEAQLLREKLMMFQDRFNSSHYPNNGPSTQHCTPPMSESGVIVKLPLFYQLCNEVPCGFHYGHCVVYDQRYLLYGGGMSAVENMRKIFCFDFRPKRWQEFSTYSYEQFTMAIVRSKLFLVGGYNPARDEYSSFVSEWKDGTWVQMRERQLPVARCDAVAVGYKNFLVVAGGFNGAPLDRVDVLDLDNPGVWQALPPLPQPAYALQSCYHRMDSTNTMWYLVTTSRGCGLERQKPVFSASLKDLMGGTGTWETIPDPPLDDAGAVTFKGHLLAVGGHDQHSTKKDIHMYFPGTNEWLKVGDLQHARHSLACVSLSDRKFVVVGGKEEEEEYSKRVYQYNLRQQ